MGGIGGENLQTGPFSFGPSPFELNSIANAANRSAAMTGARYGQLGMGGSTPMQQDEGTAPSLTGGIPGMAKAMIGEAQTQDVQNPAINTALQQPTATPSANLGSLGSLAGGLGSLTGGLK